MQKSGGESFDSMSAYHRDMSIDSSVAITRLLQRWSDGDPAACDALMAAVYDELRRLASSYLRGERKGHTLETSALIHEAFLRLAGSQPSGWSNRAQFFGISARVMRRILVDHARKRDAARRGGGVAATSLSGELPQIAGLRLDSLVELDEALTRLSRWNARQARVVELRFFGGFTVDETAEILAVCPRTVKNDWRVARAWLYDALHGEQRAMA